MTDIPSQLALLPESLRIFLKRILKTDERVATWEQNFIKAYWHRSGVIPYQMGLAIQLDHRFRSKWLLNKLHRFGYTDTKLQILNDRNGVRICDGSVTPVANVEESDDEIEDEVEIDEHDSLSVNDSR